MEALFGGDLRDLDEASLLALLKEAPSTKKSKAELDSSADGLLLIDLLVETGMLSSKGAARKEIQGGGIYVNNERASDVNSRVAAVNLLAKKYVALRRGKKTYHLLVFV